MQHRRGADRKRGGRWSCLYLTFIIVVWCWVVLLYFYWRNLKVRGVMDEFVAAEADVLREDLRIVSEVIDKDIMPRMKALEKMKMVATLPDIHLTAHATRDGTDTVQEKDPVLIQKEIDHLKKRVAAVKAEGRIEIDKKRYIRHDTAVKERYKGSPESAGAGKGAEVHVVFSTDCSPFQDWQTLLLFHSARAVGQDGHLTRIASGCSEKKKKLLTDLYKELWPNNFVHFTPDYKKDVKTKKKYDFYNKPYGVQHWLEHAEPKISSGVIVALIDPDFVFLRPLTSRVKGNANNIISGPVKKEDIFEYVTKGRPMAQQYGLGAPWVYDSNPEFNRTRICGADSPCRRVPDHKTGSKYWSVGPPYMLERDDLHLLTQTWTKFVPLVYEGYPQLLAEMYAYSMAGAHEKLPHLRMDNYMVSNVAIDHGEGWKWVDALEDVCQPPVDGIYFPGKPLPNFLHYCQFFRSRELGFQKRRVVKDIFSCEQDLLLEPPKDLGSATYMMRNGKREEMGVKARKRNGFALCVLHRSINAAVTDYKQRMCIGNLKTSYNKTINVILNERY